MYVCSYNKALLNNAVKNTSPGAEIRRRMLAWHAKPWVLSLLPDRKATNCNQFPIAFFKHLKTCFIIMTMSCEVFPGFLFDLAFPPYSSLGLHCSPYPKSAISTERCNTAFKGTESFRCYSNNLYCIVEYIFPLTNSVTAQEPLLIP